ncbi:MAG: LCP family protein [Eubacterium sp.]|nr:LCP family protein [Eubacterium sp.]
MASRNLSTTEKRRIAAKVGVSVMAVALVTILLFLMFRIADRAGSGSHAEEASTEDRTGILTVDGVDYKKKTDLMTYLFLGIDATEEGDDSRENLGGGQCDTIQLVVIDNREGTYSRLSLNRDTMTDVKSLDQDGNLLAITKIQLALAYAQVDDDDVISCENAADAVSNLLYGQEIDKYCSVRMGAIASLNQLVGGATVTIEDDFSQTDPSLIIGETVHLTDDQAVHYIHDRMNVGDGTNEARMRRQETYIDAVKPVLFDRCRADNKYALEIYDTLEPYMVTDMSRNDFIKLAAKLVALDEKEAPEITGTSKVGRWDFMEFTVDEDSLEDTVLELFYDKVEGD